MDPKDKEIADLNEENARLVKELEDSTKISTQAQADAKKALAETKKLADQIVEKDKIIEQKNNDIVGARKQYKKLSEMTEKERADLDEKEIAQIQRAEAIEARQKELDDRQAKFEKDQGELKQKERTSRLDAQIKRVVGNDPKLIERVKENIESLKDADKAYLPEEISAIVDKAANMLGSDRPNPIRQAINGSGDGSTIADTKEGEGFAATEQGKSLADAFGLPTIEKSQPASGGPRKVL